MAQRLGRVLLQSKCTLVWGARASSSAGAVSKFRFGPGEEGKRENVTESLSVPDMELGDRRLQPTDENLKFDEVTHTGQAWDESDYRMARFSELRKQVNPNVAMHLISQVPPQPVHGRVVACDGGGGALGHPKVYINLDKPGNHGCGYCGLRFYKDGQAHDGSEHINV